MTLHEYFTTHYPQRVAPPGWKEEMQRIRQETFQLPSMLKEKHKNTPKLGSSIQQQRKPTILLNEEPQNIKLKKIKNIPQQSKAPMVNEECENIKPKRSKSIQQRKLELAHMLDDIRVLEGFFSLQWEPVIKGHQDHCIQCQSNR